MAINTKKDLDNILRRAFTVSDAPSPALINRVKQHSATESSSVRAPYRARFVAIATTVTLLFALSTAALAATGVLGDLFAAMSFGNQVRTDTRQAMIENDYIAEAEAGAIAAVSENGENRLELNSYYADSKEIGLDFTLTGADIPEGYNNLSIFDFTLEMMDSGGEARVWRSLKGGELYSLTYPGGYLLNDWENEIFEYEQSEQEFDLDARAVKTGEGTYNISIFVTFKGFVDLGESARVTMRGINFVRYGDLADDNAVDEYYPLDGTWSFEFDIDGSFANFDAISYAPSVSGAVNGIEVTSVTVLPTVCRVEAVINFAETGLADPGNEAVARVAASEGHIAFDEALAKHNFLDLNMFAVTDAQPNSHAGHYGNAASGYNPDTDLLDGGNVVRCWFEIESMYFDAPTNITLRFVGYEPDVTVDIPIELVG